MSTYSTKKRPIPGVSATNNLVSRKCSNGVSTTPPIVHEALNSGGKSLDADTRSFMEQRFNYNFSHVKIHDNDLAAKSANSINALAYTSGNNIVFNNGQYNTGSGSGKKLLAHELTHVVQQGNVSQAGDAGMIQRQPASPQDDPCSVDKIFGFWAVMDETLCHMKCDLIPFTGKDCDKDCTEKYSYNAKYKRCRQQHPLPPPPDIWNETD